MVKAESFAKFLKTYKVPVTKVPVLTWDKIPTKAECEKLGVKKETRINLYANLTTGAQGYSIEEVLDKDVLENHQYITLPKTSKDEMRYYIEYLPEFDAVVFGMASMDCRAVKKDSEFPRNWERCGEFFITKDKKFFYESFRWAYDGSHYRYCSTKCMSEHDKITGYVPFTLSSIPSKGEVSINGEDYADMAQELLHLFSKYCNVGANRMYDITENAWKFEAFLRYKEPKPKAGPKQKKINDLVAIPLQEIEYKDTYAPKMAFIEKVKDGVCVLRTMLKDENLKKMVDAARIYVSKNDIISCRPDNAGNWVNMVLKSNAYNWDFALQDFDQEVVKGTKLEYFGSVVNDVPEEIKGKFIQAMLSYPVIEQIAKAGMKPFVIEQIKHVSWSKAIDPFEQVFGKFDTKKKSLTDQMGVNKYQLKKIAELVNKYNVDEEHRYWGYNSFAPLVYIKRIFSETYVFSNQYWRQSPDVFENISYLDNKTFDNLIEVLIEAKEKFESQENRYYGSDITTFVGVVARTRKVYNQQVMFSMIPTLLESATNFLETPTRWGHMSRQNVLSLYNDYLGMVVELDDTVHFRPNFDSANPELLREMHDAAVAVYNLKKDELQAKEFGKIAISWNKWLYENDDYSIVAPKTPNDIAQEGITLHHCVKSYISRVLEKRTNILFLRKKEELEVPFFTIEVTNDGAIQQIHGFGNRNLSTEPDAEPFVKEWIKKCKMKETNFNKVR